MLGCQGERVSLSGKGAKAGGSVRRAGRYALLTEQAATCTADKGCGRKRTGWTAESDRRGMQPARLAPPPPTCPTHQQGALLNGAGDGRRLVAAAAGILALCGGHQGLYAALHLFDLGGGRGGTPPVLLQGRELP